jgi:hypothetical protein
MPLPEKLSKVLKKYDNYINSTISDFDNKIIKMEAELYNSIVSDYLSKFRYDVNGLLIENNYNYTLVNKLNSFMDDFYYNFQESEFKELAKSFLNSITYSTEYYKAMGISNDTLGRITNKLTYLNARIGIDLKGNIIKDGYLFILAQTPQARQGLSQIIIENISKKERTTEFYKSIKDYIKGNKDVDGALTRYLRQYVHDTTWQISRAIDENFAEELDFNYAYYVGTEIDKTREFCSERIELLFTRAQIKEWENESWAGKIEGGDIFIDLGGYNCRHRLGWVSDDIAKQDIEKQKTKK